MPEQTEEIKACKTAEGAERLDEKENSRLADEQLENAAGGSPISVFDDRIPYKYICRNCGMSFDYDWQLNNHLMSCTQKRK